MAPSTAFEKMFFVLNELNEIAQITPKGEPIEIDENANIIFKRIEKSQVLSILKVFEQDEEIIEIVSRRDISNPYTSGYHYILQLQLKEKFETFFNKISKRSKSEISKQEKAEMHDAKTSAAAYWLTYNEISRELLLNDSFPLATPHPDSENEQVLCHLIKHPNKRVSIEELYEVMGKPLKKTLHEIARDLGFKGDLKKVFVKADSRGIMLRTAVDKAELGQLGLNNIRLS